MYRSPPFRKLALPVIIASVLSACGSDSSDSSAFSLCHDSSLDGECSADENVKSFDTLAEAQAGTVEDGSGPVIVRGGNSLMVAPSTASNASAWSTLVYNEGFVNPEVGADETAIASYLKEKLGLESNSTLSETEQSALMGSIGSALDANPSASPYAVIGAVIDTAVEQGSLTDASPSASQIESQKVLARNFDTDVESTAKATWETSDGDERVQLIVTGDDNVLVVNRWFNRIAIVDPDATEQSLETQPFAAMYTAGHHVYSTDADYVSGASEHRITQGWLADDGDTLYALVAGPSEVDVPEDDSYGLFRVPLSDGKLPTFMVSSVDGESQLDVPHRDPSVTRVALKSLENAIQLDSGSVLAYDSEAGYVRFYSADLSEDTTQAFALNRSLLNWAIANGGKTLLTLQGPLEGEDTPLLQAYNTSDLSEGSSLSLPADADTLLASKTGNRIIILQDTTAHVITTTDLSIIASISLAGSPASTSQLSADGSRAALVFGGEVHILNLGEAFPVIEGSIEYNSTLRALAFRGNDEVLYSNGGGELSSISLAGLTSSPQDVETMIADALDAIDEDSLNHSYDLGAVIHPLAMATGFAAVDYSWSSTNGHVLTDGSDNQGNVTQPAIGAVSVTDTIGVIGNYNFRGDAQTSEAKSFDITIRPQTETREQTVSTLNGALAGRNISLMAANADGSRLAAWFAETDSGQSAGLVIFAVGNDKSITAEDATVVALPNQYAASTVRGLVFSADNIYVIVNETISSESNQGDGVGRLLTYNGSAWTGDMKLDGIVRNKGVSVSSDGSVMAIAQDTTPEDAETGTMVVRVYNTASLTDVTTVYTDQDATGTRYPVLTVSNDGQDLMGYTRGDSRQLHYYNAATSANAETKALATYDISTTTFGVGYDDTTDVFVAGDHTAELKVFSASSNADWSSPTLFETSRGAWNGEETISGGGRMYDAAVANGKAYLWARYQGITAVDLTDPANPQEVFWAPLEGLQRYANALSGDDRLLFSHAYDEDAGYSAIAVVSAQ